MSIALGETRLKLLLIGANGQLGYTLRSALQPLGEIQPLTRQDVDLQDQNKLREIVLALQPDGVINASAYTAVDQAEKEPELAWAINAHAPQTLAEVTKTLGIPFFHVSTDYVFDGRKNTPYLETDTPHPLGVYGQSKLAGEQAIQSVGGDYGIVRTAWVYGVAGKGNFMKTMLRLGQSRDSLGVVMDQVGCPTSTVDLAQAIADLYRVQARGIYHFTNSGVCSWYDFAVAIFEEAEVLGIPLTVKEVKPITTADYPLPAQRPAYSVLSTQKFAQTVGYIPPHWRKSLRIVLSSLSNQSVG